MTLLSVRRSLSNVGYSGRRGTSLTQSLVWQTRACARQRGWEDAPLQLVIKPTSEAGAKCVHQAEGEDRTSQNLEQLVYRLLDERRKGRCRVSLAKGKRKGSSHFTSMSRWRDAGLLPPVIRTPSWTRPLEEQTCRSH